MRSLLFLICLLFSGTAWAQSTQEVSLRYLELDAALDYEALRGVMADDMTFQDPTGNVFDGQAAGILVEGADQIIQTQRSWGLVGVEFEPVHSFYVGQYAVHRGTYVAQFSAGAPGVRIPFITVHRVQNGKVSERRDFGEYIQSFGLGDGFDEATTWTEVIADQYLDAYTSADVSTQQVLMADEVIFQDVTAKVFGPPSGQLFEGKEALLARRTQIYEGVSDFSFDVENSFYANHHAVYVGRVNYTVSSGSYRQPAIFVIEVKDQQVTRHWDFVDYTVGAGD